jgi:histidyl-tRNA synthetase
MFALPWVNALRKAGIAAEIYPDNAKFKKQIGYANDRGFAYVAIVGESEMQENVVTLKNMKEGTQETCSLTNLLAKLQ